MVDLGQVEESVKALGPRFNLQKLKTPWSLTLMSSTKLVTVIMILPTQSLMSSTKIFKVS